MFIEINDTNNNSKQIINASQIVLIEFIGNGYNIYLTEGLKIFVGDPNLDLSCLNVTCTMSLNTETDTGSN